MGEIDDSSKIKGHLFPIFKEIIHLWHEKTEESEFVRMVHDICGSPFIEISVASSMKKSSIERARACSKMKIRASSMFDHQKLASDGHFSGSSMLGCNTIATYPIIMCYHEPS